MTGVWANQGEGWRLLPTAAYPDEATLHGLVEEAPQMLPLSGQPNLAVVGREVHLGSGYADLLAIETSGRLAIIEVKLARNAEARRAVVSGVLAYAAVLHGLEAAQLESLVLRYLTDHGFSSIVSAAKSADQEGTVEDDRFQSDLQTSLRDGNFRLVFVLDDAPPELVNLVAYLEAKIEKLDIDLITVRAYEVSGARVMLPQRVTPERVRAGVTTASSPVARALVDYTTGAPAFESSIERARPENQPILRKMLEWARRLEAEGVVRLGTYQGVSARITLLVRFLDEYSGLVTIYNDHNSAHLQFHRSVFERRAPNHVESIEKVIAPAKLGKGTMVRDVNDRVLEAVAAAYLDAARAGGALKYERGRGRRNRSGQPHI